MELPVEEGLHYFDLYHGVELAPERHGDKVILRFSVDAKDYGAVLATKSALAEERAGLLATMKKLTATPLSSLPNRRIILPQQMSNFLRLTFSSKFGALKSKDSTTSAWMSSIRGKTPPAVTMSTLST
jgi:hypothetical protein